MSPRKPFMVDTWTRWLGGPTLASDLRLPDLDFHGRYLESWYQRGGDGVGGTGYTRGWRCRTCNEDVGDRVRHELDHRHDTWVEHVDLLYETVLLLWGSDDVEEDE